MSNGKRETGNAFVRPPILVVVMGVSFLLLMSSLVIATLAPPEFPAYPPTVQEPRAVGDSLVGPADYTVDASLSETWRRFHFGRNALVDSGPWDIAFRRTHVAAAPGVGIIDLGPVPFDSVTDLPATGYVTTTLSPGDSSHPAVGKWYEYNYLTHLLRSKEHVYALRTGSGRYAKLQILTYYCASVGTGCVTFRYAYQGNGERHLTP